MALKAALALLFVTLAHSQSFITALDEYVAAPDSTYRYEPTGLTITALQWRGTILKMYSQQWLTPSDWNRGNASDPDPGVWWHYVTMVEPNEIDQSKADTILMLVTGGRNDRPPSTSITDTDNLIAGTMAVALKMRAVILYQIPNQPIIFPTDPLRESRTEDAVIAYTWAHFLDDTNDPYWIAQLPMTKAIVRAMDTAIDFWAAKATINSYIPTGGSKRGWVSWTAALVDHRVIAVIPMVMDLLNMQPSMHHMWRAYGGWTWTFKDYYDQNITARIDDPETELLRGIIDIYYYLADPTRLLVPKLVISGTNDQFFQNDNDFYWWNQMREPKYRMMCANADHALTGAIGPVLDSAISWIKLILEGQTVPTFQWSYTETELEGIITVANNNNVAVPSKVSMWSAPSWMPGTEEEYEKMMKTKNLTDATLLRDWRISGGYPPETQNPVWKETPLTESSPGTGIYVATRPLPAVGWEGFFVELQYPVASRTLRLTTQVSQLPKDTWPFEDCYGAGCYGTLV